MAAHVEVYQAKDGWRWRHVAANGRIVAESGEAFTRRHDAQRSASEYGGVPVRLEGAIVADEPFPEVHGERELSPDSWPAGDEDDPYPDDPGPFGTNPGEC